MRRIVKNLLVELGFNNIEEANDGSTALPILKQGGIDFLLTDWNMPEMLGIELLKAVRSNREISNMPVLTQSLHKFWPNRIHAA